MNRRAPSLDHDSPGTGFREWLLPALLVSILLHGLFFAWTHRVTLNPLAGVDYDPNPPRRFQLESVDLDPRLLNPAPAAIKQAAASPVAVKLPDEDVALEKFPGSDPSLAAAPKLDTAILSETPKISLPEARNTIQAVESAQGPSQADSQLAREFLADKPLIAETPSADLPSPGTESGSRTSGGGTPSQEQGFSNLDDLLAQTGPLNPETAPILMPTDLLFDYDAPNLRAEAVESLQKLGLLIQRNPRATFLIEGHTDSFGSDEYNLDLSRKRADSVKAWLTSVMGLPPDSIQTVGYGKSRLLAPADGTIEQQQINRRVEIVIRAPAQ